MHTLPVRVDAVRNRARRRENVLRALTDDGEPGSAPTPESLERLRQPETVVVVTSFYLSLLGGPASQILKCLTAIKVCEELAKHSLAAVPVCWITRGPTSAFSPSSITLLDDDSELHCLQLQPSLTRGFAAADPPPSNPVSTLFLQIEEIGRGTFDAEVFEILRGAFVPETTFSSALRRLVAALMREWEMIVVDADAPRFEPILTEALAPIHNQAEKIQHLLSRQTMELAEAGYVGAYSDTIPSALAQSLAMPVIACVLDPYEIYSYARALPVWDEAGLPRPMVWPQSSATIVDARSRRILQRYHLSIHQLYSGEREVISKIMDTMPRSAPEKLDRLISEVEAHMAELNALVPAGSEFAKTAGSCKGKLVYQLGKLRKHFAAATARRQQAVSRQIHKACNSLAPGRRVQERELAGIQIPLRYSLSGLRSLYEKLDILQFEHQLISMD
jgi:uncharacterized protein YllA (UPF0747 family)